MFVSSVRARARSETKSAEVLGRLGWLLCYSCQKEREMITRYVF